MKILLAVTDTNVGGITTALVNFCNELSKKGNEVYLLDMSSDYLCKDALDKNIKFASLRGRSRLWKLGKSDLNKTKLFKRFLLSLLGAFKKITNKSSLWNKFIFEKYKQFGEFDVAIAYRQCAPCYFFILRRVKAKTKIGFVHGAIEDMGSIASWKSYLTEFNKVAYVSNAVKDGFIKRYPELENNATTVYNMIDTVKVNDLAQESDINFDDDKINLVTVSRIDNAQKGTERIAMVCQRLKGNIKVPFCWYVIGDGMDLEICKKQAEDLGVTDVLQFLGVKSNPYPYIKNADFSIFPTKGESFGLVVVESLILGTPVVACDYPALKELLKNEVHGLIAPQNVDGLYKTVKNLIEDQETLITIRNNCLEYSYDNDLSYEQFTEAVK